MLRKKQTLIKYEQILMTFIVKISIAQLPNLHHGMKDYHLCDTKRVEDEKHFSSSFLTLILKIFVFVPPLAYLLLGTKTYF